MLRIHLPIMERGTQGVRLIKMNNLPIEWLGDRVKILDQTRLPQQEVYLELTGYQAIASAITEMRIRGAPAIGILGAYGMALGALEIRAKSRDEFLKRLR